MRKLIRRTLTVLLLCLIVCLPALAESESIPEGYNPVAESSAFTMYLEEKTMAVILQSKENGELLYSTVQDANTGNKTGKGFYQSGIVIEYLEDVKDKAIQADLINNANTIGVYHDNRILSTFRQTVQQLQQGSSVVIFPEHDVKHNHIVYDFQDKFIDIAKLYYKKTGKELSFVPMYIAPKLKKICLGKPVQFCAAKPMDAERSRICTYLMDEITAIAEALPEHTVVPYRNIPKKEYPSNISKEQVYEKAGR